MMLFKLGLFADQVDQFNRQPHQRKEAVDAFLDAFLVEAMDANGLDYVGGDDFGLVCSAKRGSVTEAQRAAVEAWLKARNELTKIELSPLLDAWYPENEINPVA